MTNFIRYNPQTGEITEIGQMDNSLVQSEITDNKPTMFVSENELVTPEANTVNLTSMMIEPKDENLANVGIPFQVPTSPLILNKRQFFQQLALDNDITRLEALDVVKLNVFPQTLQVVIDSISNDDDRFNVDMFMHGSLFFPKNNPYVNIMLGALGKTEQGIDNFFTNAISL